MLSLLQAGYSRVLLVDLTARCRNFIIRALPPQMPTWLYALALVIESGNGLQCARSGSTGEEPALPQSLMFLQRYLSEERQFVVPGERLLWQWTRA